VEDIGAHEWARRAHIGPAAQKGRRPWALKGHMGHEWPVLGHGPILGPIWRKYGVAAPPPRAKLGNILGVATQVYPQTEVIGGYW